MLKVKIEQSDVYTAEMPGVNVHHWEISAHTSGSMYIGRGASLALALAELEINITRGKPRGG